MNYVVKGIPIKGLKFLIKHARMLSISNLASYKFLRIYNHKN